LLAVLLAVVGMALVATGWRPASAAPAGRAVAVVVTARPLAAGQLLALDDVDVGRAGEAPPLGLLLHDPNQAVGRIARIALPSGFPLTEAVLSSQAPPAQGQRRVRLRLDQGAISPGMQPGDAVDIVAAFADAQAPEGGRVAVVARARVVVVEQGGEGATAAGATDAATLDVAAVDVGRVLWAEAFAKSVRLLVRPDGDTSVLFDVGGAGP
jgi:Flp pilus assembly protein CpaB